MSSVVFSITSTKGGPGKTTTAVNLGAVFAAYGLKTLLMDADVQNSASKYYPLSKRAPYGLSAVIQSGGRIGQEHISSTQIPNLDIVVSDCADETLQTFLKNREDRLFILHRACRCNYIANNYQVIIIDTQGAKGELQRTAAMAADYMVSPINPTILSVREFVSGTLDMLASLNSVSDYSTIKPGKLYAFINGYERTVDATETAKWVRDQFRDSLQVTMLDTVIPRSTVYPTAATKGVPAWQISTKARETLLQLVWELFPNLKGMRPEGEEWQA